MSVHVIILFAFKEFQSEMRIMKSNNFKLCSLSDLMYMYMVVNLIQSMQI